MLCIICSSLSCVPCLSEPSTTLQWPVLEHDGKRMNESLAIIEYLDKAFPDTPQLVAPGALSKRCSCAAWATCWLCSQHVPPGAEQADAGQLFIENWIETSVFPILFPLCLLDAYKHVHPDDKEYWKTRRESPAILGMPLEKAGSRSLCCEAPAALPCRLAASHLTEHADLRMWSR